MTPPPPPLILSFDFDGTLIDPNGNPKFHPRLLEVLRRFQAGGAKWTINTGRGLASAVNGLAEAGLFLLPDFIIANECEIYEPDLMSQWKDRGRWNKQARKENDRFHRGQKKFYAHMREWVGASLIGDAVKADQGGFGIVTQTPEAMDKVCEYIRQFQMSDPVLGYQRNGCHLRFAHSAYTKGTALVTLCQSLSMTPQITFAAGDNFNDLPMLDPGVAAFRACPSNADPVIKKHLEDTGGFIASKPASEGMLEALEHFFPAWF